MASFSVFKSLPRLSPKIIIVFLPSYWNEEMNGPNVSFMNCYSPRIQRIAGIALDVFIFVYHFFSCYLYSFKHDTFDSKAFISVYL